MTYGTNCCVPNCKSNYVFSSDKVPVYKLPQNNEDKKNGLLLYLELTLLF